MGIVENPVNAISRSVLLRERINNYPLSKENEKVTDRKVSGENKTSKVTPDIVRSKDVPERTAYISEAEVKVIEANLGFTYDGEIKKAVLRVVDEKTKKVVFQVPPEEMIARIKEDLKKDNDVVPAGIIVDKKV